MLQWMVDNNIHKYIAYLSLILMVGGVIWLLKSYTKEVFLVLQGTVICAFLGGSVSVVVVSCFYWFAQIFKYVRGEQVLLFSTDLANAQLFTGELFGAIGGFLGLIVSLAVINDEKTKKTSDSTSKEDLNSKSFSK